MNSSTDDHSAPNGSRSDDSASSTPAADAHADKYNDPRATITGRGLMLLAAVLVLGIAGAAFSIWARRTHLEKTSVFWGGEVIEALQLAEEVELLPIESDADPIRLSGMPGLGHLRHVLLDDRSYDWSTETAQPITDVLSTADHLTLRLSDPSQNRFPVTRIVIDLDKGWVGREGGSESVRLNDRFRVAMPTYLKRVSNYEPLRAEVREANAQEAEQNQSAGPSQTDGPPQRSDQGQTDPPGSSDAPDLP